MPSLRRLPPVHSPVDAAAALRAVLTRSPRNPTQQLERLLAERFSADRVILCGSGTQALQLALSLARSASGRDTAALPAYTCYDIVSAAVGAGISPAFYDLDPDTLLPDAASLQRAVDADPAALVAVHHFGIPTPIAPLVAAAPRGTWVIEDAAQAHGGSLDGRRLGSLAPLSVLSFGRGKGWTGGGGGALLLRGAAADLAAPPAALELDDAGSGLAALAKLGAQWLLGRPGLYALPTALPWLGLGRTVYHPPAPVQRMLASAARVLLASDAAAEREAGTRRAHAARIRTALPDAVAARPFPERGEPGYLRLPFRIPGMASEPLLDSRARRLGILPSYPRPLPALEVLNGTATDTGPTPGAAALARELFTAPTHSHLAERDLERIERVLHRLR